jgi:hypothetical protein
MINRFSGRENAISYHSKVRNSLLVAIRQSSWIVETIRRRVLSSFALFGVSVRNFYTCSHIRIHTSLKVMPSAHRNLAAVEFTFIFNASFLCLFARCLSGVAPAKVIKFPVGICGEDKIPDRERKKIYEHPCHVRPAMSSQDNQYGRKTKNHCQQD